EVEETISINRREITSATTYEIQTLHKLSKNPKKNNFASRVVKPTNRIKNKNKLVYRIYMAEKGYGKKPLWQWILIYVVVAAIVYGAIYYLFLGHKGGGYGYSSAPSTTAPNSTY